MEDDGASSGLRICILSVHHPQAAHRHAEVLCTGEEVIMLGEDTKKDVTYEAGNILYLRHAMSIRLMEGGLARVAGQSCLAGPSVAPAAPKLRAPLYMGVW